MDNDRTLRKDCRKCGLAEDHTVHTGGIRGSWPPQPEPHTYVGSYDEPCAVRNCGHPQDSHGGDLWHGSCRECPRPTNTHPYTHESWISFGGCVNGCCRAGDLAGQMIRHPRQTVPRFVEDTESK